ncbi:hypothetical protein ACRAWG_10220 [Methylobacterium sp. P31]
MRNTVFAVLAVLAVLILQGLVRLTLLPFRLVAGLFRGRAVA